MTIVIIVKSFQYPPKLVRQTHPVSYITPENLFLVLAKDSSYHNRYKFKPEDVKILKIKTACPRSPNLVRSQIKSSYQGFCKGIIRR